ncbi:pesticin C-terminus-like muramidase [Pseudoalteromonas phenolica]|nr:pesticin C-terminus-like muramidase [Pseudoalteromonas phenolica]
MPRNDTQFIQQLKRFEGEIAHLYLDSRGNPTIGVGFLMANAQQFCALNLVHKKSGKPASNCEKQAEYKKISKQETGYKASWYAQFCELTLPSHETDKILHEHIAQFKQELSRVFNKQNGFDCQFEQMPLSAQYALLDMAFNLGTPHLAKNWPKLHQAIKQQDWHCAAQECSRRHIQSERNAATEQLFKQASKTSSPTTKPSVLSWLTSRIKSKLLP